MLPWPGYQVRGSKFGLTATRRARHSPFWFRIWISVDDFVVQFDAVQTDGSRSTSASAKSRRKSAANISLSVFFRASDKPASLKSACTLRQRARSTHGLPLQHSRPLSQWHNYAVRFSLPQ